MAKRFQKILISIIIFALVFTSYGLQVKSIASEGKKLFSFSFFHKDEIALNVYFEDDLENVEKRLNVNDTAKLTIEVNPLVEGYLKEGSIELNLKNGSENNFKIQSYTIAEESEDDILIETIKTESLLGAKAELFEEKNEETNSVDVDNVKTDDEEKMDFSSLLGTTQNITDAVEKESKENFESNETYEVKLKSENAIQLKNIVKDLKLYVEIAYKDGNKIIEENLYEDIVVELEGTFINSDLNEIEVFKNNIITLGWEYTKDIEISSEYIKFSPFTVGNNLGTIVENAVSVKRNTDEEKSLPIKETNIKIEIPKINDKLPIAVNVSAKKLMATLGGELTGKEFTKNNWFFDEETGILEIKVTNTNYLLGNGEDVFNIICRYEDYIEEETLKLNKNVIVTVEELSSNSNIIQEKNIKEEQEVKIKEGELISYYISTTDEKINKGKINANYYATNKYESEFSDIVNLNVLIGGVLEEIVIQPEGEFYEDQNGNKLDASEDVKYKGVKFKLSEIKEMLENGSTIDLLDENNNVFHTITNENDSCLITFLNKINTVKIRINNVKLNGNIKIEFLKSIEGTKYSPKEFSEINKLSSSVKASVKYLEFEDKFSLPEIKTEKVFTESNTEANLFINKEYLSTVTENENIELKIELNNNLETSDFYKNPYFEIVFPKYIKEVKLNNIYTLFTNGLSIKEYNAFNENGINKIRIDFEGTQTEFNSSNMTNGSNIIVNANLVVDEITPRMQDEIKLYYCNEAVSNYQTQTNWSISKEIPEGIIKDTNGYDSTIIEYQAPIGLITINSITNYDGTGTTIKSIREGEKTSNIPIQVDSQIANMELVVMNNTGNECDKTVLIGRIPFKGNKDVESGEDLGTNVDTLMKSVLIADSQNANMSTIYYSNNPNADQDLSNPENRWVNGGINLEEIKSYMIIVDGIILPGAILKYKYDFEIPANLGFDAKILGSFGAFYNNKSDNLEVYESSVADKVGLMTDVGPKLEAKLSVDIGDGAEIAETRRLKYTVVVTNVGSIIAENVIVDVDIPDNTIHVQKEQPCWGDYGYLATNNKKLELPVGNLNPGESVETSYYVKTANKLKLEEYAHGKDENGYYRLVNVELEEKDYTKPTEDENENSLIDFENEVKNEGIEAVKEYITEVPKLYAIHKAIVKTPMLTEVVETNEVKNEIVYGDFCSDIRVDFDRKVKEGLETNFTFIFKNISGKDLENVVVELNVGDIYHYQQGKIDEQDGNIIFDETAGKVTYVIGNMAKSQEITLTAQMFANQIEESKRTVDCYFEVFADEIDSYKSTVIPQTVVKAILDAKDISVLLPETINENEKIIISTQIDNIGDLACTEGRFEAEVSEELDVESVITSDGTYLSAGNGTGKISARLPVINVNDGITIDMTLKAKNTSGQNAKVAYITRTIKNLDQDDIVLEKNQITILNTEKTEEEIEQDRIEQLEKENEEQKRQEEEDRKEEENKNNKNENNKDNILETDKDGNFVNNSNNNDGNKEDNKESSGNNSSNQNNQNNNNLNDTTNSDREEKEEEESTKEEQTIKEKYTITGAAWVDMNKNGTRDNEDKTLKSVKVYLLTLDNRMLKSTITNSSGKYQFNQVENGKYIVAAVFDEDKYAVTTYKKAGIPDEQNSDVIKSGDKNFSALTNEILVNNANIENIDIGVQNKDTFDLTVRKYISKIKLTTNKRNETYEFDNLETAKVEIKAKEIEGAKVDFEYTIVLENVGNVKGYVEQLVDFIEKDITFDESKNPDWVKGNDGYVYAKNINKVVLDQGEKKEFKLYVTKTMTEDNVGTVVNKASILKTFNSDNEKENTENNTTVQNTVILISTGYTAQLITLIISTVLILMLAYIINNNRRIRNKDFNIKINTKKVYK